MKARSFWTTCLLAGSLACSRSRPPPEPKARAVEPPVAAPTPSPPPPFDAGGAETGEARPRFALGGGGENAVSGRHGIVTSAEANATRAGVSILELGGNAADAAVAVAAALAVTHPNAGNLGGGGFALVRPPGGPTVAIDFRETAPGSLVRKDFDRMIAAGAFGPSAVGVPGSVAGLLMIHRRFGSLPLEAVLRPAISLAADGHPLGAHQAKLLKGAWPRLSQDRAARAVFGRPGAGPKRAGEPLIQPELARTLERVARDAEAGFYAGETASAITTASGNRISAADLAGYRAIAREPLSIQYGELNVEIMPPPSAGGAVVAGTLLALERLGANDPSLRGSARELHLFIETSRRAQALRRLTLVDPDALSAGARSAQLAPFLAPDRLLAVPVDPEHATPSRAVHPLYGGALRETEHTTHLSASDARGMVVSLTTTLSASFGARVVAPGTGVVLNNAVASFSSVGANQPVAGRRTTSSMAPTLVLDGSEPILVLGTPGGDTIPSTVVQILRNLVDHRMPLDRAIDAPRLHHGFVPDVVRYEAKRPPDAALLAQLKKLGHLLVPSRLEQGDANCLLIEAEQSFGYADPREPGGLAAAAAR